MSEFSQDDSRSQWGQPSVPQHNQKNPWAQGHDTECLINHGTTSNITDRPGPERAAYVALGFTVFIGALGAATTVAVALWTLRQPIGRILIATPLNIALFAALGRYFDRARRWHTTLQEQADEVLDRHLHRFSASSQLPVLPGEPPRWIRPPRIDPEPTGAAE